MNTSNSATVGARATGGKPVGARVAHRAAQPPAPVAAVGPPSKIFAGPDASPRVRPVPETARSFTAQDVMPTRRHCFAPRDRSVAPGCRPPPSPRSEPADAGGFRRRFKSSRKPRTRGVPVGRAGRSSGRGRAPPSGRSRRAGKPPAPAVVAALPGLLGDTFTGHREADDGPPRFTFGPTLPQFIQVPWPVSPGRPSNRNPRPVLIGPVRVR